MKRFAKAATTEGRESPIFYDEEVIGFGFQDRDTGRKAFSLDEGRRRRYFIRSSFGSDGCGCETRGNARSAHPTADEAGGFSFAGRPRALAPQHGDGAFSSYTSPGEGSALTKRRDQIVGQGLPKRLGIPVSHSRPIRS